MKENNWKTKFLIINKVLEMPIAQQKQVLKTLCGSNLKLHEEIEQLLSSSISEHNFLSQPGLFLRDTLDLTNIILAERYKCLVSLGKGSFGEVWLAEDQKLYGKKFVIKFPHTAQNEQNLYQQSLASEVKALARLNHPSIVGIIDTGLTQDNKHFIVMNYVEGTSLRKEISGKPWSLGRVSRLVRQLALALEHAHQNGVIHSDLKPENIILRNPKTFNEQVVIVDFGISTLLDAIIRKTDINNVFITGTKAYMSPEQQLGQNLPENDIFALGVITWELLMGARPNPLLNSKYELHQIAQTFQPNLPVIGLDILLKAIEIRPENRFSSALIFANSFINAIESYADISEPLSTDQPFYKIENDNLHTKELKMVDNKQKHHSNIVNDFARMTSIRKRFGGYTIDLADYLIKSEIENKQHSGSLELQEQIQGLQIAGEQLSSGRFRLLVLGDMKRGKSSILNVLLGENLLPSAVTKCTAVLTIIQYGLQKRVVVHFKNKDKKPEELSFSEFRQKYTIQPRDAEMFEQQGKHAFPEVNYAIVEYPLPLLEKGVEIVDSPGLNDTAELNQLTLGFIRQCNAIFFVLDATNAMTMTEKQYIEDYLKGRGQTVFFLINKWDLIRENILDPDNEDELYKAEEKVRKQFKNSLENYFDASTNATYQDRVFALSARSALRKLVKDPQANLEGTGFAEFLKSLVRFLEQERLIAELRLVRLLASSTYRSVHEKVSLRIPLLSKSVQELDERIKAVEPEFEELINIRNEFSQQIDQVSNLKAKEIANSLRNYLISLPATFEADFENYQPDLKFFDMVRRAKREEFQSEMEAAFKRYMGAKISIWSKTAEKDIEIAFAHLATQGARFGAEYSKVTTKMSEKLTGIESFSKRTKTQEDDSPWWIRGAAAVGALACGDVIGASMAATKAFGWKEVLVNAAGVIAVNILLYTVTGFVLTPIGILLPALGFGAWQAANTKKKIAAGLREQLVTKFPEIASEASSNAYHAIKEGFIEYRDSVIGKINNDIEARRAELDNLRKKRSGDEFNRETEVSRLQMFDSEVLRKYHLIEQQESKALSTNTDQA